VGFNECALVATQTLSGLTPTAKQSATLARASATHPILKSGSLPLPPHRVHRAERRSMLLDASAPQRMTDGASAVGTRCWAPPADDPKPWREAPEVGRVGTEILSVRLIVAACRQPPHMHWRTYDRLVERYEAQSERWGLAIMRRFGRRLR
jgi:hypothetical protein